MPADLKASNANVSPALAKIISQVQIEIRPLIPKYFQNRKTEVEELGAMLKAQEFEKLRRIGHNLKGNAVTYGFAFLSDTGKKMEAAAIDKKSSELAQLIEAYKKYIRELSS